MLPRTHFNGNYGQSSTVEHNMQPARRFVPNENNFQGYKYPINYGQSTSRADFPRQEPSRILPTNNALQSPVHRYPINVGASTSRADFPRQDPSRMNLTTNNSHPSPAYHSQNTSKNTLGVMNMPKPTQYSNTQGRPATSFTATRVSENVDSGLKMKKKSGETEAEKLCVLTGTVERVIKYGKIFQNHFCYFQVIGSVVSIADGKVQFEKTMLLRDKKGPILQLTYYSNATHIFIDDFHLGQNLRAVGRMTGPNVMSAITIRAATDEELDILPRMCYVSDYAVSTLCGDKEVPSKS